MAAFQEIRKYAGGMRRRRDFELAVVVVLGEERRMAVAVSQLE